MTGTHMVGSVACLQQVDFRFFTTLRLLAVSPDRNCARGDRRAGKENCRSIDDEIVCARTIRADRPHCAVTPQAFTPHLLEYVDGHSEGSSERFVMGDALREFVDQCANALLAPPLHDETDD